MAPLAEDTHVPGPVPRVIHLDREEAQKETGKRLVMRGRRGIVGKPRRRPADDRS